MPITQHSKDVVTQLRAKLLDISKRNSLISFKHRERSRKQLRIVDIAPDIAFKMLEDEKPILIEPLPLPNSEPIDEQTSEFLAALEDGKANDAEYLVGMKNLGEDPPSKPALQLEIALRDRLRSRLGMPPVIREKLITRQEHAEALDINPAFDLGSIPARRRRRGQLRKFQTLLFPEELERQLSGILDQAKLSESETGMNTLFAAFGFLEWYESTDSSAPIFSPLLLYPLEMSRVVKDEKFVYSIASRGEDVSPNVSLQEKMKRDFGLLIVDLEEEETPAHYFSRVARIVESERGWKVHANLTIGFFSFAKLAMYHDLDPENLEHLEEDGIVCRLIEGSEKSEKAFVDEYEVDSPEMSKRIRAMIHDADSSQLSAVIDVLDGKNLVIEGPPGTGKSQTITNIIAAALEADKTVLFIAEKKAALDVVKKRLDEAGLGEFCLELHSNKTRKKEVLKSLDDRLQASQPFARRSVLEALLQEQDAIRLAIGAYVGVLNAPFGDFGKTLHEIAWRYLRLRQNYLEMPLGIASLKIEGCEKLTELAFQNRISALKTLERHLEANLSDHPQVVTHPWYGIANPTHTPADSEALISACRQAVAQAKMVSRSASLVPVIGEWSESLSIAELAHVFAAIEAKADLAIRDAHPQLICTLANSFARESAAVEIRDAESLWSCDSEARSLLGRHAIDDLVVEDISRLASQAGSLSLLELRVGSLTAGIDQVVGQRKAVGDLLDFAKDLAARAGIDVPLTTNNIEMLMRGASLLREGRRALQFRSTALLSDNTESELQRIERRFSELRAQRASLQALFDLPQADSRPLRQSVGILRNSTMWSWFTREFWNARRAYYSVALSDLRVSTKEMASRMAALASYLEAVESANGDALAKTLSSSLFNGIDTDFGPAMEAIHWVSKVRDQLAAFSETAMKLRQRLLLAGSGELESLDGMAVHPRFAEFRAMNTELGIPSDMPLSDRLHSLRAREAKLQAFFLETSKIQLREEFLLGDLSRLDALLQRRRGKLSEMEKRAEFLKKTLIDLYPVVPENLGILKKTISFVSEVMESGLPKPLVDCLLGPEGRELFGRVLTSIVEVRKELLSAGKCFEALDSVRPQPPETLDVGVENPFVPFAKVTLRNFIARVEGALGHAEKLHSLTDYLKSEEVVRQFGLHSILDVFRAGGVHPKNLDVAYEIALAASLLRCAALRHPTLNRSVGFEFDELRSRFRKIDGELIGLYRRNLRSKLLAYHIPEGIAEGRAAELTDLGLINREIGKLTKLRPIRELLRRAGRAVRRMKPCFMMSPLSVSQFLSQDVSFDLVVMDEASQLRPEEALGAVARANQVIVVGDQKQLPPTNFFHSSADTEAPGDVDLDFNQESIMDLCVGKLRARRLKWHYRSKHESLIAFSNHSFYDSDLVVFPSPYKKNSAIGVHHVRVDGIYEKGRNLMEARTVADAAVKLMQEHPGRSLGIVAMNQEQRDIISELLEGVARHDVVVQNYIARWDRTLEPFFVKNLENVQGDERDVIFISTVYGRDPNGNFYQRFGPINGSMGHRRLNVLFSRSKWQMTVFTSMDADRIAVDSKSSIGVRSLKQFLDYARTGMLAAAPIVDSERQPDSEFEVMVLKELSQRGFTVVPQLGVAGYFIDLAIQHPEVSGRFILGIECDGAQYHSAKSARDRDKTRQDILESLGWKIHRIWSTDWFQHKDRELSRLLGALPPLVR